MPCGYPANQAASLPFANGRQLSAAHTNWLHTAPYTPMAAEATDTAVLQNWQTLKAM
jgi:hypothetical protein